VSGHSFHYHCISRWCNTNSVCPLGQCVDWCCVIFAVVLSKSLVHVSPNRGACWSVVQTRTNGAWPTLERACLGLFAPPPCLAASLHLRQRQHQRLSHHAVLLAAQRLLTCKTRHRTSAVRLPPEKNWAWCGTMRSQTHPTPARYGPCNDANHRQ